MWSDVIDARLAKRIYERYILQEPSKMANSTRVRRVGPWLSIDIPRMQGTINTGLNPEKTVDPDDKRLSRPSPHKNASRKKATVAKQTHTDDNVLIVDALEEELYQSHCRKRTYSLEQNISG